MGGRARRWRGGAFALLAAGFALVTLSSCSVAFFPFGESSSQLASTAAKNWQSASGHEVAGALRVGSAVVSTKVVIATSGESAIGAGDSDGAPYDFIQTGGNSYLKGQKFWQAYYRGNSGSQTIAKGFQEHYAVADGNHVADALNGLSNLSGSVTVLASEAAQVKQGSNTSIDGVSTTPLTDTSGRTWWVTSGSAGVIVKFSGRGAGNVSQAVLVAVPANAPGDLRSQLGTTVDPNNPSTLPALYSATDESQSGECDQNACVVDITVVNGGGQPAGQGVVTVTAYTDPSNTTQITNCAANIPGTIATNQSGTATCSLTGAGWTNWANANPGTTTFYIHYQVTANPPYV